MPFYVRAYQTLVWLGSLLKSPLLLILRLYFGWNFMLAGWNKLSDIATFAASLQEMHVPLPIPMAYAAGLAEFVGGICLMVGFASRLVAIPLIIVMIVAYITVHTEGLRAIFTAPSEFIAESPFNYLLTSLIVLAFGPGRFSIDYLIERWLVQKHKT